MRLVSTDVSSFTGGLTSLQVENPSAAAPDPEPGTLGLLALGGLCAAAHVRRRRA